MSPSPITPRPDLTLAFIGGSLLWFAQFNAVYALAETACNTERLHGTLLGVPLWQWLALLVTFVLGAAVAWTGWRGLREVLVPGSGPPEQRQRRAFMGYSGAAISVIYLLVIGYTLVLTLFVPPCR